MKIKLNLNGRERDFEVSTNEYLLETLRNNHITSVKNGCDKSTCGACTVLMDGKPVLSCSVLSLRADGHSITTVDGLQKEVEEISDFFGEEGADQCGFCNTGMALTVYALKHELKNPTDEQIKDYMVGNLCRCTGYHAQFKAIKSYLEVKK
jgi:aerobic carbon-monoxide dehydrogenase small subunit